MTDRQAELHGKPLKAKPPWWFLRDHGAFWWLASAVFAANGLVSAWQHTWWLAVMQIVTAMLAVRAAVLARVNDVATPPRGE
jgi:uncharacterized membrane protein HdeD (DUF308 family)